MYSNENSDAKRLLGSLTPEMLNRLADLIVSKLKAGEGESLLSK